MVDQYALRRATMSGVSQTNNYSSVLDDRISTTERILGINRPVPKDVYERLKKIEDRILYLEGICPEYNDFWVKFYSKNLTPCKCNISDFLIQLFTENRGHQ